MLDDQSPLDIPPFLKISPTARLKAWRGVPLTHVHPERFEPPETERVRLEERELKTKARIAKMLLRQEIKEEDTAKRWRVRGYGGERVWMTPAKYARILGELPVEYRDYFVANYSKPNQEATVQPASRAGKGRTRAQKQAPKTRQRRSGADRSPGARPRTGKPQARKQRQPASNRLVSVLG
jgi:hypothetical protein